MNQNEIIESSLKKLEQYIMNESYRGYDPYDALTSPLFAFPILRSNTFIRLASQQVLKRMPLNIRPLLGIKKGYNPVTLGLALQAIAHQIQASPERSKALKVEGDRLVVEIEKSASKGYSGHCWGYDFDWQARYATIPAYCPTIVATGFVTNALFSYYEATHHARAFELCRSAVEFVLSDLHRTQENETFCFSYSPKDAQVVYNATLKGARLLSQVFSVTRTAALLREAKKTVQFVVNHQNASGSWAYAYGDKRTWADNFHTGYILDCLESYAALTGDHEYGEALGRGVQYFLDSFFVDNRVPKYYNAKTYPIDSTAVAQSILTLARFGKLDTAVNVTLWSIENMQSSEGFFYYQKNKFYTNKISYMRWSNAWMLVALTYLLMRRNVLV